MSEIWAAAISAIATLLVAAVGFWQWTRSHAGERRQEYREKRVETLSSVWQALTEMEARQRDRVVVTAEASATDDIRALNLLLLRSAPFLLDDERAWASEIVERAIEINTLMRVTDRTPGLHDWWYATAAQPPEANIAAQAAWELQRAKAAFGARYAAVTRGDHD